MARNTKMFLGDRFLGGRFRDGFCVFIVLKRLRGVPGASRRPCGDILPDEPICFYRALARSFYITWPWTTKKKMRAGKVLQIGLANS